MTSPYKTPRAKAWRNLLIAMINAGIEQKLIGLKEDENYWTSPADEKGRVFEKGVTFDFSVGEMPAAGYISDAGFGELHLCAALFPREDRKFIRGFNSGFHAGEAFAHSWLERRKGAWLQTPNGKLTFSCRRELVRKLAAVSIAPLGYADHGRFMM
jgi:hypothetical protein